MRRPGLNVTLAKATPLIALIAASVVFGLLYVLLVQPRKVAADAARARASQLRAELAQATVPARQPAPPPPVPASGADFAEAVRNPANSPEIGGVAGLAIENEAAPGTQTVKVSFDAQYEQIGRFLWSLRSVPAPFELRSIDIKPAVPSTAGLLRATILISLALPQASAPAPSRMQVAMKTRA